MKKKTVVITGASRGVGAEIAKRLAQLGWNVVIFAKTEEPNLKLPGTIYTVAEEIQALGGRVLPLKVDVRFWEQVEEAMKQAARFGGGNIDALINNASAIILKPTEKQIRLMNQVIIEGTRFCTEAFLEYSNQSANLRIINIAPPLPMAEHWVEKYESYAVAKREVSEYTELTARLLGVYVNTLWPKTMLFTAATKALFGEARASVCTRNPKIMADAAALILQSSETGRFFTDESALEELGGVTDFSGYLLPGSRAEDLMPDVFV
jgi:citronellol/citronellal dehydrogenase